METAVHENHVTHAACKACLEKLIVT